ncbi:site-specific recombinase [Riemerella anatipestifer]|uniref:Site-specific recombinase n=1 Tax=Riemerella anatipestifer TaxID=34085 RepID=A0AAP6LL25_RIEAN|nr:hypothetical protein [Riemerella anatipestifer]MCD5967735.1 site-specific recombinase [Riemerella anatipestifer]MCO4304109.1 site-specific recombinase [Riemerella anatipestifer]MCO7317000.1 site-specific recombinase [Riemerella anatipestifer]MCO7319375.1 site-specific recombinase [Riemerella anatipestifer]MCO7324644.1 site-specific recombinase [Riemerella anatipestifer]
MGTFWISFITVFLIRFFNFIVSFGLSMPLAFRSRKVKFGEVELIYREIFNTFVKNPAKFFIPIKSKINTNAEKMVIELEKERKKTLNKIDFLHHIFTCYFFKFLNKKRFPQSKVIF